MGRGTSMSRSVEEYLEALYNLAGGGGMATTKELAERLGVAAPSVSEMLKRLADEGYVDYSPYLGAALTEEGLRVGEKLARKHRLLERFLHDILKIAKERVHRQACEMEHSLSDEAEESLCRLLNHPDRCPDDEVIPACDLPVSSCAECLGRRWRRRRGRGPDEIGRRRENLVPVSALREHDAGRVAFIRGDRRVLQRLVDMGLTPGTRISVVRVAPLNGPTEVEVRGSRLALGHDIASKVFVEAAGVAPEG